MKTYRIIIANETSNYTSTKYNNTLNGFASEEAASKAAKEALRDAAGEMNKGAKVFYSETLNAWILANNGNYMLVAKIEAEPNTPSTMNANGTTENKTMYTDYYTAVNWCHNHRVMCNNIAEIDPSVYDNARFAWYDEETEADTEIFQWFITDCSEDDVDFLESRFPGLLFTYSDLLDCFVLCVDHFGTMWKGVAIETTLEYAAEKSNLNR